MDAIRFENITKAFGKKVIANKDISFSIEKGLIYSLLGENGSGKTSLMNVLVGIYKQDSGKIFLNEEEVDINSPSDAYKHKIGMIHQHFKLVNTFTATENIVLGLSKEDYKTFYKETKAINDKFIEELKQEAAKHPNLEEELRVATENYRKARNDAFDAAKASLRAQIAAEKEEDKKDKVRHAQLLASVSDDKEAIKNKKKDIRDERNQKRLERAAKRKAIMDVDSLPEIVSKKALVESLSINKKIKELERETKNSGRFNLRESGRRVSSICQKFGFNIDPQQKVYDMSVSQKQTLEIVKALYRGVDILILDEPTAVLTPQETKQLFKVLRNMRKLGKTFIIITHKLNEVMEISDKVAVLRRGEYIGTVDTKDTNEKELTNMMVGRKIDLQIKRDEPMYAENRLYLNNITVTNIDGTTALDDVSFVLRSGEILGVAGISGSGQKELLDVIAGLRY